MVVTSDLAADYLQATALGAARAADYCRLLGEIEPVLGPLPVQDIAALEAFLDAKQASGSAPNTIRKDIGMLRAFYRWMYEHGQVSADTYLAARAIRSPPGSSRRARPEPYRRNELTELSATLDERWPTLDHDEAWHWLRRWHDGRSPYSRIRSHAIRTQLDAVIALALRCGLRRDEIFRLDPEAIHPDNAYIVVWDHRGTWRGAHRVIPYTDSAREAIAPWVRMRAAITPDHPCVWLNLWSAETMCEPMTRATFDKLLATYVGPGWTLRQLRATCIVNQLRAGLQLEHLRQILGYSDIAELLPYARCVGGDAGRAMNRLDAKFSAAIDATDIAA